MSERTKDLEFWMTNLPQKLRNIPITHLAIPGSHDSTTYTITKKSNISPDARPPIQHLKFLEYFLAPILLKWSQTQCVDILEQLNFGIRYFDLRISTKKNQEELYLVHNLYGVDVRVVLNQIKRFLDDHPHEIVVLDCQHFFNLTQTDHNRFMDLLKTIFNFKLLPYSPSMANISLNYMTRQFHYQVLVIYRADAAVNEELLWPAISCHTPWPDTVSIPHLMDFLDEGLRKRNNSLCFVSQCVLTPTVWFALKNILGSLKTRCVLPLEDQKYCWLKQQKPGGGGLNIVISDFVEEQDFQFSKEVICLNKKLFRSMM